MIVEIKVPGVGESVTEAILAQWFKQDGDRVNKGEVLFVIETDKVTLEVESEADGILKIAVSEGETVAIGAVVGTIDSAAAPAEAAAPEAPPDAVAAAPAKTEEAPEPEPPSAAASAPVPETQPAAPPTAPADIILSPAVRRLVTEKGVDVTRINGTGPGGRANR